MDKIYQLLKCLKKSDTSTQRDIAKETGFSLGMVNTLLKNMEEQGLITIHAKKGGLNMSLLKAAMNVWKIFCVKDRWISCS